jgi:hypothetical protein
VHGVIRRRFCRTASPYSRRTGYICSAGRALTMQRVHSCRAKKESQSFAKFNAVGGMLSIYLGEDLESYVSAFEYYSQQKLTKQEDKWMPLREDSEDMAAEWAARSPRSVMASQYVPLTRLSAGAPADTIRTSAIKYSPAGRDWGGMTRPRSIGRCFRQPYKPNDLQSRQLQR